MTTDKPAAELDFMDTRFVKPEGAYAGGVNLVVAVRVYCKTSKCAQDKILAEMRKPDYRHAVQAWASKEYPNYDSAVGTRAFPVHAEPGKRDSGVEYFELPLSLSRKP